MASRDIAYDLLLSAILDIRTLSERRPPAQGRPTRSEDDIRSINVLAHLIHNWPEALRDASDDRDFDAVLRKMWRERDRRSDPWLAERLAFFGVDHRHLEAGDAGL